MATVELQERMSASTSRVDRTANVIRGVKIIGETSVNGRRYPRATLEAAVGHYEGIAVNVDHPAKGQESRSYKDRIGYLSGVHYREGGLFGDLHLNPKHPQAEQLLYDAEHSPNSVGLSHNVRGKSRRENGVDVIEEITRVLSVDLVADPASVKGLFESRDPPRDLADLRARFPELAREFEAECKAEMLAEQQAKVEHINQELARLRRRARARELAEAARLPLSVVEQVAEISDGFADDKIDLLVKSYVEAAELAKRQPAVTAFANRFAGNGHASGAATADWIQDLRRHRHQ